MLWNLPCPLKNPVGSQLVWYNSFEAVTSKSQVNNNLVTHAMEPSISAEKHCWFSTGLISPGGFSLSIAQHFHIHVEITDTYLLCMN